MKMTLEASKQDNKEYFPTIVIDTNKDGEMLSDLLCDLIIPCLVGTGVDRDSVIDAMREVE